MRCGFKVHIIHICFGESLSAMTMQRYRKNHCVRWFSILLRFCSLHFIVYCKPANLPSFTVCDLSHERYVAASEQLLAARILRLPDCPSIRITLPGIVLLLHTPTFASLPAQPSPAQHALSRNSSSCPIGYSVFVSFASYSVLQLYSCCAPNDRLPSPNWLM